MLQEKKKVPFITLLLVGINIIVFFYVEWKNPEYDTQFMLQMGASYEPYIIENHEYYRIITHTFLHYGFEHLINNMVSLLVLGYTLEKILGSVRFTILYFLSGILAGVTSIVYNVYVTHENVVSCGASGAIYGLTGALLILLIIGNKGKKSTEVPRYLVFLIISIYSGMRDPSINNAAHVGGLVAGALLCFIMTRFRRMEVTYEG